MCQSDEDLFEIEKAPWADDQEPTESEQQPDAKPFDFLRAPVKKLSGVVLKEAEILTRSLLPSFAPKYSVLPSPTAAHEALYEFICGRGFESLPLALDPGARGQLDESGKRVYGVPGARAERKRVQIANMVLAVSSLSHLRRSRSGKRAFVDFCGGCGHVGLVVAALYPKWRVTIVDTKAAALAVARARATDAGLRNVRFHEGNLYDYGEPFDTGAALHACGAASDGVLELCVRQGASIAVAPCCVGAVVSAKARASGGVAVNGCAAVVSDAEADVEARSRPFRAALPRADFAVLARAADYGEAARGGDSWRSGAKALVEADRCEALREAGYRAMLVKMRPEDCSPKNDIIVAAPAEAFENGARWGDDGSANKVLACMLLGGATSAYPPRMVADIERRLIASVVAEGSSGEVLFPCKQGARERKLVHAVAERLGLSHKSRGGGAQRRVHVSRNKDWPLYLSGIVGVSGAHIQRVGSEIARNVPAEARKEREDARGGYYHLTLIKPRELRTLMGKNTKEGRMQLLHTVSGWVRGSVLLVHGLGTCQAGESVAYYAVVDWEAAQRCREALGLPRTDLHITLGFVGGDVHDVCKDVRTVILEQEMKCAPWAG